MDSTYWIKYSDYDIVKDERGMDCIKPAANAVPMCYDVAVKLGRNVAELMNIVLDDHDVMGRNMKFARRFGLLGLALEEDNYLTLPDVRADMSEAVFAATGRTGDNYAGVFSPRVQREGRQHQRLARLAGRALQPRPGHAQRPHGGGALRRADAADHAGVRLQEDARGKDDKALPGLRQGVLQRRPRRRGLQRRVRAGTRERQAPAVDEGKLPQRAYLGRLTWNFAHF